MNPKYKFTQISGCTAADFLVNGKSLSEITKEERYEILDYLLSQVKQQISEYSIQLEDVVRLFQNTVCENDGIRCDQCGDSVTTTTWEI